MPVTAMPTRAPVAGTGRRYVNPVVKDAATFLESTSERTVIEIELAPGGGNTPHRHRTYAEHFTVRQGRLAVVVDGASRELAPGEEATAPMMSLHHFANPTAEPTVFRVELRPGHPGFEKAIRVAYGLAADGRTSDKAIPRNPLHTALILAWSDMLVPGPLSVRPVLRVLVALARALGVERALERRYPPHGAQ
jgi:mannose-6-phosphate isomerase-like protein (cupin superfamily)